MRRPNQMLEALSLLPRISRTAAQAYEQATRQLERTTTLRASGSDWDLRKKRPYMGYEQYDFNVPVATEGDTYARYLVRVQEFRESLKIVEQALNKLPMGPVRSDNRKFVAPPRSEIGVSMEALIHHFKLFTEGYAVPMGEV